MFGFFPFKYINGGIASRLRTPVEREISQPKRTDNDNFATLPLETKSFEGLRVTLTQGLAERGWAAALTGQAATAAQGALGTQKRYYEYVDNFTNSNGTGVTSHSSDAPQLFGYAAYNYTTEPTIETNRLRGPGAADTARIWCVPYWYPTVKAENDFWLEVSLYRRNSTAGATTGIVNTGVLVRGSGANGDGFVIGWNELDDEWYILEYVGGVLNQTLGQGFGNGVFTGTSQERKLLIHVYTFTDSDPFYNVQIDVFVDSGSGYGGSADFYGTAYGTTFGGLAYYEVGQVFEEVNGVDVDWIRLYDDLPQLEGARLTVTPGEVVDHSRRLTGLAATATAGNATPGGGADVEVALTGEDAVTAQGTITPETPVVGVLTGLAATTSQGALTPAVAVLCEPSFSFSPRVAWTYYNATVTYKQNPGNIGTQFLPWNGVLYGAGNDADEQFTARWPRTGFAKVSQVTEETWPWTANPKWTSSDNSGMSIDDPLDPNLIGKFFPRGFASSQDPGPRYNTVISRGGWLTLSVGGNIWSAVERVYNKMGQINIFLAPHSGEVASPNYYNGPELFTGTAQSVISYDPLRQRYHTVAPMGIYALSENEALGFYPQIIDGYISGKFADLVGLRATTTTELITPSYTGSDGAVLVGFSTSAVAGTLTNDGPNKSVALEAGPGHELVVTQGALYARDANVVPAFRRLKNGAWGSTPVVASSFTGAARAWTRSHYMTVVPTGYSDLIYVVYYSEGWANVDPKIGVLVMDAATGTITSNTLYAVSATPFSSLFDGEDDFFNPQTADSLSRPFGKHRTVALAHKLGSGTHVTQFLFCGQIVHLSWTSGTRTTPTVTIKDGVTLTSPREVITAWDSLEVRGDKVYHVVPAAKTLLGADTSNYYDGSDVVIYYNDATGTSSTWTSPSLTIATSGTKAASDTRLKLLPQGGYGDGRKSWWYAYFFSTTSERGHDTGWFDAWYSQPKLISVESRAVLGRVTTSVSYDPNITLTGFAATTAYGTLYADITYQRQLTGQVATTAQGTITPEVAGGDKSVALTGQAATTAYGTITPSLGGADVTIGLIHGHIDTRIGVITIPIVDVQGLAAVTAQGVLGLAVDQAPIQTGLVATATQGAITPDVAPLLTGQDVTALVGQPVPEIAAPSWSWGLHSEVLAGVLERFAEDLAALTGVVAATAQGTITPLVEDGSAVSGLATTTASGTLTPVVLVIVTGAQTATSSGVITAALTYQLTGLAASATKGLLSVYEEIFLTGRSATATQGVLGYQYGGSVAALGLSMYMQLGDVTETFKKPPPDLLLWALRRTEELFAQEAPDEENPVVAPNE